jgi:hypothetical protein
MDKRTIIYTVLEKLKINSGDSKITPELVSSMIDTKRAMLLKSRFSRNAWNIPIEIKQEICMDIERVDSIDGFSLAGKTIRTSIGIPRSIKIRGKDGPLMVRREDGTSIPINIVPIERLPYIGNNKFTSMLTYGCIDYDGRLVLTSTSDKLKFIEKIKVTNIFESPESAYSLECRDNNSDGDIEPWDMDYPLEASMIDEIVEMIVKDLFNTIRLPGDNENDSSDERG